MLSRIRATRHRLLAIGLIMGALAAAVAGGAVSRAGAGATEQEPSPPMLAVSESESVAVANTSELGRRFEIFRTAPPSPMPDAIAREVASSHRFGRNPALARQITTANGRGWVVPGDRHICIVVPDRVDGFATSCTPLDWALRTGVMVELRDADGSGSMTMLAPDGKAVVMSEAGEGTTKLDAKAGLVSRSVARDEKVVLRD